jgi:folate-binding protein YgfZ
MAGALDEVTQALLDQGPWLRDPAPFAAIVVKGRDAEDYLQRLCSQDVMAVGEGRCAPAAFLDAKGKLQHTCALARLGGEFWLDTQAHQAAGLLALLDHYHFTEKVGFAAFASGCAEWVGAALPPGSTLSPGVALLVEGGGMALCWERRGVHFVRVHAPNGAGATLQELVGGAPARALDENTAELLRMGAGIVRVGTDTEPGTLALEADLDDHVSLTKGCFTGQEIVARIHTYGHVNRGLRLLHLQGDGPIAQPMTLVEPEDGVAVGRVMRALPVPGRGLRMGFGYLPHDFRKPGTRLRLGSEGGDEVVVAASGT